MLDVISGRGKKPRQEKRGQSKQNISKAKSWRVGGWGGGKLLRKAALPFLLIQKRLAATLSTGGRSENRDTVLGGRGVGGRT